MKPEDKKVRIGKTERFIYWMIFILLILIGTGWFLKAGGWWRGF